MLRQVIIIIAAVGILAITVLLSGVLSKPSASDKRGGSDVQAAPARIVEAFAVENTSIQTQVPIYGKLVAYEKTDLYSEVGGMLLDDSPVFRAGMRFRKGDILLKIDKKEQQLNLQAARSALLTSITQMMPDIKIDFPENLSAWEDYRRNFDVTQKTPELPTPQSDREKNYVTLKNIYNQYYTIKSTEERLTKFVIYAPFTGEITQSFINTGSFIRAGQQLGTLMNTSSYELEASIPLTDLAYTKVGDKVTLGTASNDQTWSGRIARISNTIDSKTQSVKLYIKVSGSGLRENMFLTGFVDAETVADVVEIPRKLVKEQEVFIINDTLLAKVPIQVIKYSEQTAIVRGISNGTQLLKEPFTGAYAGMRVQIAQ